jgi:G:T-mismatch repair DNA endonuclease (very short patch repair protein)
MAKGIEGNKVRTITCIGCGLIVTKRMQPGTSYCTLACYRSSKRPVRRTGEHRACAWCGNGFYVVASRVAKGEGRFCSLDCHNANQGNAKTSHTCLICGEAFRWSPSRTASGNYNVTYCSLRCRDADPERVKMLRRMNQDLQLRRMTKVEANGYALLDGLGVEYKRQAMFGGKFTPDAVVPASRLVVQFDGDYWHDRAGTNTEPRVMKRVALDRSQDAYIRSCGWEVIRLWESDLRSDPADCAARVSRLLLRPLAAAASRDPLA